MNTPQKLWTMVMLCAGLAACSPDEHPSSSCHPACLAPAMCVEATGECVDAGDMPPALDMPEQDMAPPLPGRCEQGERVSGGQCVACAPGTTRPAGDDPAGEDTACERVLCGENFHVVANQCQACAPGSLRPAGDEAAGAETICAPVLCLEDERVRAHLCAACEEGFFNQGGDDASGEDTSCDAVICAQDEHVSAHQCVACEPGTSRPAGDDASQEDTMCERVLCAENQRVLDHVCVDCSPGLTRTPGDDASGEDTVCTRWETPLFMSETHTCARMQDRTLKCWGRNNVGQLGIGNLEPEVQPTPTAVSSLFNVVDVSIGHHRSCAIVDPGQVKCWGSQGTETWLGIDSVDTFVPTPSEVRNTNGASRIEIPIFGRRTCILQNTGQVSCWGANFEGATGKPESSRWPHTIGNVSTATRLELGPSTSCASLQSGQATCWGANDGLFANGTSQNSLNAQESSYPSTVIDFAFGNRHVCALLDTKEVWCSGSNTKNQISDNAETPTLSPSKIEDLSSTMQLAVSIFFNCARGMDEKVRCWGTFSEGTVYKTPRVIGNLEGARDIQVGFSFGCALLGTGEVACWGENDQGQLGDGTRTNSVGSATRVSGIDNAVAIHVGPYRACALLADGQIMCWGNNEYGVLGDGTTQDRSTPVLLNL